MKIIHYDLFAGIGGFSLALDTIFHDQEIKHTFCEWEAFPTAVLKKHWPEGTFYGDIADLVTDTQHQGLEGGQSNKAQGHLGQCGRERSDETQTLTILTGGFPCQPFSRAGRRAGTADDRYKWPEMFTVIQNLRPEWVIAENVRGLVDWDEGVVLEKTCTDLEREGYEVQPLIIPAVAVGALHRRDRVWIIANLGSKKLYGLPEPEKREEDRKIRYGDWDKNWQEVAAATCIHGIHNGLPRRLDGYTVRGVRTNKITAAQYRKERLKACGNSIVPQVAMEIFAAIRETLLSTSYTTPRLDTSNQKP
ncbi:hypothetical protein A2Z56_02595 [Candidatus Kaiserbacteria bacterium RIFCSPHIGHO2_12_45_16]|nr:MAG: hypothetical protein A2Z56_02595 [Candidatus Kaiserbacteria bacterium RIFCSPHIGHO2_12_45_16]